LWLKYRVEEECSLYSGRERERARKRERKRERERKEGRKEGRS
jgi:hypothetical protein